jgi:MFS family permease
MSKPKTRAPWLTKNLVTLSWVSFLQDAASEMLYPLLPVLLNTVFGAPAAIVGAIEGAAEGAAALTKLFSHKLNRFAKRKTMIGTGYALAAVGKLLVAIAGAWPMVLVARVVDRLGKGLRSAPRDAVLLLGVDSQHKGRTIGFHRTADTLGAVLGPSLALALLALFDNNLAPVLWIAVIPGTLSAFFVLRVRDNEPRPAGFKRRSAAAPLATIDGSVEELSVGLTQATSASMGASAVPVAQDRRLSKKVKRSITVLALFSLANFPDALILLHLSQVGYGVTAVVALYLVFNVSYAALSFPAGLLADRYKPNQIFAIGLLCFAAAYIGLAYSGQSLWSVILVILYGGFAACQDTVGKTWVAKQAPASQQLAAQSFLQGFSGISVLVAGVWAGLLWTLGAGFGSVPLVASGLIAAAVAGFIYKAKLS